MPFKKRLRGRRNAGVPRLAERERPTSERPKYALGRRSGRRSPPQMVLALVAVQRVRARESKASLSTTRGAESFFRTPISVSLLTLVPLALWGSRRAHSSLIDTNRQSAKQYPDTNWHALNYGGVTIVGVAIRCLHPLLDGTPNYLRSGPFTRRTSAHTLQIS